MLLFVAVVVRSVVLLKDVDRLLNNLIGGDTPRYGRWWRCALPPVAGLWRVRSRHNVEQHAEPSG